MIFQHSTLAEVIAAAKGRAVVATHLPELLEEAPGHCPTWTKRWPTCPTLGICGCRRCSET